MEANLLLHPTQLNGFALFLLLLFWKLAFNPLNNGTTTSLGLCAAFEDFIWFEAVVIKRLHKLHFVTDHLAVRAAIGLREDN